MTPIVPLLPPGDGATPLLDPLFDLSVDILIVAGLDGYLHRVSESACRVLGYSHEELLDRSLLDLIHPDERDAAWAAMGRLARGEVVRDWLVRVPAKEGEERWISWNIVTPPGVGHTYGIGRDITEHREAELRLRESEERFELAVVGSADGIWDWPDVRTPEEWWSPRLYELLGYEPGEVSASLETYAEALHPDDRPRAERMLDEHFRTGAPFDLECRLRTKSGEYRWYRTRGQAVRDEQGRPRRMAGVLRETHEYRAALERVRRSEDLLRETGEIARVGGWEFDVASGGVSWSPEVYRILGRPDERATTIERAVGRFAPEVQNAVWEAFDAALAQGRSWDMELPAESFDGRRIWVRTIGRAESENGTVKRLFGAVQDVTEQKEAEETARRYLIEVEEARAELEEQAKQMARQAADLAAARERAEEAARIKSAFLATMSHEIRTPMNGVIGMVSLLHGTPLSDEQREYLDTIRVSGESLLALIDDILDFSKLEAGMLELSSEEFDLSRCCDEAGEILAARAAAKRIDLAVLVDGDCPATVWGDSTRLRQVLLNLLSNAVKFTDRGEVRLGVRPDGAGRIRFEVRDSGIGISVDAIDRLFMPFTQADSETTRKYGGTGLGLAICRQIVQAMGGEIGVESEPGSGSCFWFSAPLQAAKDSKRRRAAPAGTSVVLAAPSGALRDAVASYAESSGARVGLAAIDSAEPPRGTEVLFVESAESGGPGLAWIERARTADPGRRAALLAWPGSTEADAARAAGVEVLLRPVKRDRLVAFFAAGRRETTAPPAPAGARLPAPGAQSGIVLRVLVADDNPVNRRVAGKMLERLGHGHESVENGLQALERLSAGGFDLVLMDCQMPEMDGFEASRELRRRGSRLPIVALTANALDGDRERCLEAGMDDYLAKPIDLERLAEAVERWRPAPAAAPEV